MTRRMLPLIVAALAVAALPARSRAQEKPDAAKPEAAKAELHGPAATLRVQVVISRYQGERKIASLPYTLVVTTGGSERTRMRMGVETPVPVTSTPDGKQSTAFQYRNVGTNIDCGAWDRRGGTYQLSLGVESSSALALEKGPQSAGSPAAVEGPPGVPLFRSFNTRFDAMLRDGQSLQTIASTDPVTGEVVKIDVTMTVVK